jgi:hypothetical protein
VTEYLPRSAWTSTSAAGATLTGTELVGVALHWPGTTLAAFGVESRDKIASRLRGWRDFHVNGRGWSDIGYNIAIDQAGRVWMARSTVFGVNRVGAHCASASNPRANHKYAGVLLILGAKETPTAAMVEAFRDWYRRVFLARWPSRTDVRGHGQVPGASTSCQGPAVLARIKDGTWTGQPSSGGGGGSTGGNMEAIDVWRYKNAQLTDRDAYSFLRGADGAASIAASRAGTAASRAAEARIAADAALVVAKANGTKLDALLKAQQGLTAELAQVRGTLDAVRGLVEAHTSGTLDAEAVAAALAALIHQATAPAGS